MGSSEELLADNGKKVQHILAIRFSAMGDVAMTVPVLSILMDTYPELTVTVLTKNFFIPLFSHLPNVSVYDADLKGVHSGVLGLGTLATELRDEEIDAVADLHDVLRTNVLKSLFYFYGIKFKQIDKGRAEKKALTRDNNKEFRQLKSTHQRYADVFEALGFPLDLSGYKIPPKRKLLSKVLDIVGKQSQKWLGIAPFAQHGSKCYPTDLMEEVLAGLSSRGDIKIILFGGGDTEKEQLENWEQKFKNTKSVVGKLRFSEELSLISNLDTMLSMDSGNAHLAAIFGVSVVSIWGVTHPYTGFKAFNQPIENCILPDLDQYPKIPTSVYGNKVPEGYDEVMRSIPPEKVVQKILENL
ncbi:glycosyltransferase family 9 protein [Christiangramia forsetii]|uniref:RfaQ-like lipopolysaccharide core biosynthesis glycosyl transferase n=2 Tax=Christiangramia forsetii TaxID=411153 RepID=A0M6H6_CHRFK|nr:glycosyltransferase family 9 protein [Christiangramia forsetii]GGG30397.1 heptosyltransferase [Christiangramia forsetii]CAL68221.1 RfaQ-like lipopolysaccharide core biosynthesis glycosyl transferase [Christiangramia forsetii KT0803]